MIFNSGIVVTPATPWLTLWSQSGIGLSKASLVSTSDKDKQLGHMTQYFSSCTRINRGKWC